MSRLRAVEDRALQAERILSTTQIQQDALNAAVTAAEFYLQAFSLADNATDRSRLDAKCKESLARAELIKDGIVAPPRSRGMDAELPISKRRLTTREEIILLEGSKLNSFVFQKWKESPQPEDFQLKDGEELFVDSPRLQLSPQQLESFAGWMRPREAFARLQIIREQHNFSAEPTMKRAEKVDLVQDMTSDCSVVASLCADTSRAERGHPRILASVIYPYDHIARLPAMSPSGRYVLRLYFNGCYRKVEIDDLLPVSKTSRVLHVLDRSNPGCLWPALLEKAYLKVRGGYDFPGSNSGTDIAVFTGWIPEQIFLHDDDILPEELWGRIFDGFFSGKLLLTIGTGKLPRREQSQLGLAAEHDYAILEMRETDGEREMLIKNPWSNGDVWKGASRQRPNPSQAEATSSENDPIENPKGVSVDDMTPGTFWMDFGSVFQHFENLYLNWHPGIFRHRQDLHFSWDLTPVDISSSVFEKNPQISVESSTIANVWLLLTRHFRTGDYSTSSRNANGFISLSVFHNGGRRVLLSDGANIRGPYVDSPNTLLRFEMPVNATYTAVVASQNLPISKHNFTLSAFSNAPVKLAHATARYASFAKKTGAWTRSTAGGSSNSPTYLSNPQFCIRLPAATDVAIALSADGTSKNTPRSEIHVKILLLFTNGLRITKLRTRDIVANSGDYRRGSTALEISLEKGAYTIICSTFERHQFAKFTLSVYSSSAEPLTLEPLPAEGSGRLSILSAPATFSTDINRLLTPLAVPRLTRARFVARHMPCPKPSHSKLQPASLVKLSLEQGQGPYKRCLASSASDENEFDEANAGLWLEDVNLSPDMHRAGSGGLWLVVERMAGVSTTQTTETLQIEILTEEQIHIGPWGHGEG